MMSKKKVLSMLLLIAMLVLLCACGNNAEPIAEESGTPEGTITEDTRTPEEIMSTALLEKGVEIFTAKGHQILSCEKVDFYEYNGQTLAYTDLYYLNSKGTTKYDSIYGIFDASELQSSYTFEDNEETYKELREFKKSATSKEFEVTTAICDSVGIQTYHDWWVDLATNLACNYLMHRMDDLKNPYTIEVNSVDCYIEPEYNYVWFTVTFTAENNLGGKVTATIGNTRMNPIVKDSTDYMTNAMSDEWYYCDKEPDSLYAKQQEDSFRLDATAIQEYILENY